MPIFFEKTSEGESTVLSIYGTKDDIARLAENLREGLAMQNLRVDPNSRFEIRGVKLQSTIFDKVEVVIVGEDEVQALAKRKKHGKALVLMVWLAIIGLIVLMYYLN